MKHSEIKYRIIETASDLFYRNGYNATGINQIIAEAGIAKATLYNHFKSKEAICLAYLEHKNITFLTKIKSYCEEKPEGKQQVIAVFDFLQEFYQGDNFNGCWCIKTVAEIPRENVVIRTAIQHHKLQFLSFLENNIKKNIPSLPEKEAQLYTKQLYLLYESAVAESHLHQEDWPIKESKALYSKLI